MCFVGTPFTLFNLENKDTQSLDRSAFVPEVSDLNEVNEANFLADDLTDEASKGLTAPVPRYS